VCSRLEPVCDRDRGTDDSHFGATSWDAVINSLGVDPAHKYEVIKPYKGRKGKMTRISDLALASIRWKLTFWHRSFTFKFWHILYVKCE